MNQPITITSKNFAKFSKRLQKQLEKKFQTTISYAQAQEILSQSLGLENLHEMQSMLNAQENVSNVPIPIAPLKIEEQPDNNIVNLFVAEIQRLLKTTLIEKVVIDMNEDAMGVTPVNIQFIIGKDAISPLNHADHSIMQWCERNKVALEDLETVLNRIQDNVWSISNHVSHILTIENSAYRNKSGYQLTPVDHDLKGNPIYSPTDLMIHHLPVPIPGINEGKPTLKDFRAECEKLLDNSGFAHVQAQYCVVRMSGFPHNFALNFSYHDKDSINLFNSPNTWGDEKKDIFKELKSFRHKYIEADNGVLLSSWLMEEMKTNHPEYKNYEMFDFNILTPGQKKVKKKLQK